MEGKKRNSIKRILFWFGAGTLVAAYILVAGRTNSCSACATITQMAGIGPVSAPPAEYPMQPLEVGQEVPDGTLLDEDWKAVDLSGLVGQKPTVLVFYRGGWCPYCSRHLAALAEIEEELKAAGFQLVAISADRPEVLRRENAMKESPYRLLSDSSMEVSRRFGIAFEVEEDLVETYRTRYNIDLEGDSGYTHHLLPHPSVYVVDRKGRIRFQYTNKDYKVRLDPEKILKTVQELD